MNYARIDVYNTLTSYPYHNMRTVRVRAESGLPTTLSVAKNSSAINVQNPVHAHLSGGCAVCLTIILCHCFILCAYFYYFIPRPSSFMYHHIHNIMFYTFRFYSRTRQRRPFGNRCLEHFPGEYDQFGMIKLRFTAPGSAGYVHIPQGVTVFHKSLATRRPRVYVYSRRHYYTRYTHY